MAANMVPTIHRNGTAAADLLDSYMDAMRAVRAARKALIAAAPHGRDYYPQGDHAIHHALVEHAARDAKLGEVLVDLESLAIAVQDRTP